MTTRSRKTNWTYEDVIFLLSGLPVHGFGKFSWVFDKEAHYDTFQGPPAEFVKLLGSIAKHNDFDVYQSRHIAKRIKYVFKLPEADFMRQQKEARKDEVRMTKAEFKSVRDTFKGMLEECAKLKAELSSC